MLITPVLITLTTWISTPAHAAGDYRDCLRKGEKGAARSCRGNHRGHHRQRYGRQYSHLQRILGGRSDSGRGGGSGARTRSAATAPQRSNSGSSSYGAQSAAPLVTNLVTTLNPSLNPTPPPARHETSGARRPTMAPGRMPGQSDEEAEAPPAVDLGSVSFADIEAAVNQDIAACANAQSTAAQCCGDPMACRGQMNGEDARSLDTVSRLLNSTPDKGGLKDYCGQMKTMSGDSRNLNSGLAAVCFDAGDACENVCEDLAQDYTEALAECNGCEAQTAFQNALRQLQQSQRSCSGLGDKADQLADTGFEAAVHQAIAQNCTSVSAANSVASSAPPPITAESSSKVPSIAEGPKPESVKGLDEESSAGAPHVQMQVDASQGFKGYSMDRGPETQGNQARQAGGGYGHGSARGSTSLGTVTGPSTAGVGVANKAPPVVTKKTPVMETNRSVASASASASPTATPAIGSNANQFANEKDLGQLLPAGVRTAMYRSGRTKEINDPAEDLFVRITKKFLEKCRLGVLLECTEK